MSKNNKEEFINVRKKIETLDESNVLGSIEALPEQITDAWEKASKISYPKTYQDIDNIIVFAMGGSALGTHVIKDLYKDTLPIPVEIYNHYDSPAYLDENTLVLLSSYSGNTEEVISAANQVKNKTKKIAVITSGGKLKKIAETNNYPTYKIDPIHNPSNEPRMAIGYAVTGQLALLNSLNLINIEDKTIKTIVKKLKKTQENLKPEKKDENTAKYLSYVSYRRIIALVSAEHLRGAVHVFNNQLNENAKNLTIEMSIPEMNHHYMEALSFPEQIQEDVIFLFFNSSLYHERVQARFPITQSVAQQKKYPTEMIQATAPTKLEQVFEIIQLGAYTNFYLAMLNQIDPAPIPTVDFFKKELKKLDKK